MFLARKISRAKWPATRELSVSEIPADAVTGDLRTQNNALSFFLAVWHGFGGQCQ